MAFVGIDSSETIISFPRNQAKRSFVSAAIHDIPVSLQPCMANLLAMDDSTLADRKAVNQNRIVTQFRQGEVSNPSVVRVAGRLGGKIVGPNGYGFA
jgi:hypothetical protein